MVLKQSKRNFERKNEVSVQVTDLKSSKNFQKIKSQFILKRNDECDFCPMKVESIPNPGSFEVGVDSA